MVNLNLEAAFTASFYRRKHFSANVHGTLTAVDKYIDSFSKIASSPMFIKPNKDTRVQWNRNHRNFPMNEWLGFLVSDEVKFSSSDHD